MMTSCCKGVYRPQNQKYLLPNFFSEKKFADSCLTETRTEINWESI